MKKKVLFLAALSLLLSACGGGGGEEVENYYVINMTSVGSEMLNGSTVVLEPQFTNLGEACTPKYSVAITYDGNDVTSSVYNETTKVFAPTELGSYSISITVLKDDGTVYKTDSGKTFTQSYMVDVVLQSFAPINDAGPDVNVSQDGVITFGETYSNDNGGAKIDSNQYKVTGVSFTGNYSITYKMNITGYDPGYGDCALYFGWNKNWKTNNDDCIKLGTGSGLISTWVWDTQGNQADLGVNRTQGWTKGGWWDFSTPVNSGNPITGEHTITFERYVNVEREVAIYGLQFDNQPFTYLNVGKNYSDLLTNVWVESNNTAGTIEVVEYKKIEDKEAPNMTLNYAGDYTVGDAINLIGGTRITDNSAYASKFIPTFKVFDSDNLECEVVSGVFTPSMAGTYKVKATVYDLAFNVTEAEADIIIKDIDLENTVIDLSQTSAVALPENGIILYYSAKNGDKDVAISEITCEYDEEDYTEDTIFHYVSPNDPTKDFYYFQSMVNADGLYTLKFKTVDGAEKTKEINVDVKNTQIYDWTYYELGSMVYKNRFAVGRGTIYYYDPNNVTARDRYTQTCKLGHNFKPVIYNWTIEYDVTDINFVSQGKLFVTKSTMTPDGDSIGWEDLTIGGQKKEGNPNDTELWGYECDVQGTGWVSYEWRSVWQDPTTEFMPDPTDPSKGCGREGTEYDQYILGTHHYKMTCEMDEQNKVTYKYYIDGELEVVHHTAEKHDGGNGIEFFQLSCVNMGGLVSNFRIY